jgi:hypothetical protein
MTVIGNFFKLETPSFLNTAEFRFYVPEIYIFPSNATSFGTLQVLCTHKALFTSISRFQNFKPPTHYIFRALTKGTFLMQNGIHLENFHDLHLQSTYRGTSFEMKWLLLRDCLHLHVFSRTTITFCWSAIQLIQIGILLYRTKVMFLVRQS